MTTLPDWMIPLDGRIVVDPDRFYPAILDAIGAPKTLDRFWLECAYQCMKLEVQRLVSGTELDPRPALPLRITVVNRPKWRLTQNPADPKASPGYPEGAGASLATRRGGRDAYRKWRGFIPA